uniref:Uncharacterized protein n=1 Tax=Rhizophora mucronata TaxID=61149 RepID=A0A2P2Q111_RHIMU
MGYVVVDPKWVSKWFLSYFILSFSWFLGFEF